MKVGKRKLLEQGRREYERIELERAIRRGNYKRNVIYPAEFESMAGVKLEKGWKCPKCRHGLSRTSLSTSKIITWSCEQCGWKVQGEPLKVLGVVL